MPAATKRWTAAEVLALVEPTQHWPRYEVVDGELLVTPGPAWSHQEAALRLWRRLDDYLRAERIGHAFVAPADVVPDEHSFVQPDVFVVPLVGGRYLRDWTEAGRLLLAAEVLSPGSVRHDRVNKRHLYQRMGVPEYWIIDVQARLIERWRPRDERGELMETGISWQPEGATSPLVLDLAEYFGEVLGEW